MMKEFSYKFSTPTRLGPITPFDYVNTLSVITLNVKAIYSVSLVRWSSSTAA